MRKVLISCAVLAAACTGGDEAEAPVAPVTTETPSDLIVVGAGEDVEATTTTVEVTTTTEPPATTTTAAPLPILCPHLSHPAHHEECPEEPAEYLQPVATTAVRRGMSSQLASIRACESGGDYTAVSPNGLYYGAYQFHHQTWASVGGTGNPAHASPAEQDMRAQMMIDAGRRGEWPNC